MVKMLAEINEQPSAITRCAQNNMDTVRELAERVKSEDIDSIVIAARGTSDHAAVYGKYVLEILTGLPVGLSAPSVYTMYHRTLRMDRCLVIGISQSGMAEDVLTVIHSAKKSGALTVSITNDAASPLAKGAHYHLDCSAGIEKSVAATKTFTTEMYLLAALAARIAGDGSITEELARLPETMSQMLNTTNDIEEKVQRYRFMDECFVLARGINYAVALEAALKIQETNYVRAKAYATSDFYHGPLALLDRNIPVVIFAPKGASFPDIARMTGKLEEMGMEMIVVSNDAETLAKGDCQLRIPDTDNDIISPYFNVIHVQLFACQLALAKGLDPDSPRRLNKVTITK